MSNHNRGSAWKGGGGNQGQGRGGDQGGGQRGGGPGGGDQESGRGRGGGVQGGDGGQGSHGGRGQGQGQGGYGQGGYGQGGYGQPAYGQGGYSHGRFGQRGYDQGRYGQGSRGQALGGLGGGGGLGRGAGQGGVNQDDLFAARPSGSDRALPHHNTHPAAGSSASATPGNGRHTMQQNRPLGPRPTPTGPLQRRNHGSPGDQQAPGQGAEFRNQTDRHNPQQQQPNPYRVRGFNNEGYEFAFEDSVKDNDPQTTLDTITKYAKTLVPMHQGPKEIDNEKEHRGFRTGYGTIGDRMDVATNFLRITFKDPMRKIYVYQISMLRSPKPDDHSHIWADNEGVEINDRLARENIFKGFKKKTGNQQLNALDRNTRDGGQRGRWVTDLDHIWSVEKLFAPDTGLPLWYRDLNVRGTGHQQIKGTRMAIRELYSIDLSLPVPQLFADPSQLPSGDTNSNAHHDPAVLARGLNAFVTCLAKMKSKANPPQKWQKAYKASNKFYFMNHPQNPNRQHSLDINRAENQQIMQAREGFFVSVRPSSKHLLLNINTVLSPFFAEGMTAQEFHRRLRNIAGNHGNTDHWRNTILRGTQVRIRYSLTDEDFEHEEARVRTIKDIGETPGAQSFSNNALHGNVQTYFWLNCPAGSPQRYDINSDFTVNLGTWENPCYYPATWVEIKSPQLVRGLLRPKQTEAMIGVGQRKPAVNANKITTDGVNILDLHLNPNLETFHPYNFGLNIGRELIRVPARILPQPEILYRYNKAKVMDASWNLMNAKFTKPSTFPNTSQKMIMFTGHDAISQSTVVETIITIMKKQLVAHGVTVSSIDKQTCNLRSELTVNYENELTQAVTSKVQNLNPSNMFFYLEEKGYDLYAIIKRVADIRLGLNTTCMVTGKANRFKHVHDNAGKQICSNIAMKCNLKGGGENHSLSKDTFAKLYPNNNPATPCNTIVVGADVAHPLASASPGCPSIASVVGSVDDNFTHFPGSMRLQFGRQECITKLGDMVKERLIDWAEKHNNTLPKRVLFYRDGVSESQYDAIRVDEIPQIEHAFELADMYLKGHPGYPVAAHDDFDDRDKNKPPAKSGVPVPDKRSQTQKVAEALEKLKLSKTKFELTYIIVGKRHNTRFYPIGNNQTFGPPAKRNGNVPPGLCVDDVVTHPYSSDFYLQSHNPIQGTGRSAHYFVITNQMGLTPDELQTITNGFCYIYAKATRGVSYCAPAYYADRLCDRGRAYLRYWLVNVDDFKLEKEKKEEFVDFKFRVLRTVYNSELWRPRRDGASAMKYRAPRRNPWHPNMDNIMFYL